MGFTVMSNGEWSRVILWSSGFLWVSGLLGNQQEEAPVDDDDSLFAVVPVAVGLGCGLVDDQKQYP
jgi:hypothetical protein